MQLYTICKKIKEIDDFSIVCIQSSSKRSPDLCSYFEGSHILSNDFNLEMPSKTKSCYVRLNSGISIDDYEKHFKQKKYTYVILEYCVKSQTQIAHHKVTRSSNKEILGLTSLDIKANLSNVKNKKAGLLSLQTKDDLSENKVLKDELFLSIIAKGIDPLTGEVFPEGHAWLHPKITSDIKEYLIKKESSNHPPEIKTKKSTSILKNIKRSIKAEYDINLVLIESGSYVIVIEEDAQYFFDEFDFKQNTSFSFPSTGFPTPVIEKYKKQLKDRKVKFCYLEQKRQKADNKRGFNIIRTVIFSTDSLAIGQLYNS